MIKITPDKKKEIITKYNSTAHFYEKRYSNIQFVKFKILLENYTYDEKIVLDAGCGTGLVFKKMLRSDIELKNKFFFFIGLDISWEMLKIFLAKLRVPEIINTSNKFNLILADMEYLPIREGVIHSVISSTSLQNLSDIQRGIQEITRVAKDDADLKFSILKKKLNLVKIKELLNEINIKFEIFNKNDIEDILIQGKIKKI